MSYYPQQYASSQQGYAAVQPKQGATQKWRSAGNHVNVVNYWAKQGAARKSVTSQKSTATTSSKSTKSVASTAASTATSSDKGSVQGDWYAKWYYGGARKLPADMVIPGMEEGLIFKPHQSGKPRDEVVKEQAEKRAREDAWKTKAGKNYHNYCNSWDQKNNPNLRKETKGCTSVQSKPGQFFTRLFSSKPKASAEL